MGKSIDALQMEYDLALSNATCYSMRNRGWDSAEHDRLGRVLHEKHLALENAKLKARVAKLETALERIALRGYEVVREEHRIARAALEGRDDE